MLPYRLLELEGDGSVHREVHAEVPSRVDYSLTQEGQLLRGVVRGLNFWANQRQRTLRGPPSSSSWQGYFPSRWGMLTRLGVDAAARPG